jgi:hypothetical protein
MVAETCLGDDDWAQIERLLAEAAHARATITGALNALRASLDSRVLPAGPITDQLLDVWALAHQVDPLLAKPAEVLLSSLVGRDLVTSAEITNTCDLIEAAMAYVALSGPAL